MQKDCSLATRSEAMNENFDRGKCASKRSSSPLPARVIKKMKDDPVISTNSHCCEKHIQKAVASQVELMERLVFKDLECQKLKKKFEEIDRNCRRWHDFAVGLQSRVKRLALILHRQQDTIKSLQTKDVQTVNVCVQTDDSSGIQGPVSNVQIPMKANISGSNRSSPQIKKETEMDATSGPNTAKTKQGNVGKNSLPSVFIDLTDEDNSKSAISLSKNSSDGNLSNSIGGKKIDQQVPVIGKHPMTGSHNSINNKNPVIQTGRTAGSYNNSALYVVSDPSNMPLHSSARYTNTSSLHSDGKSKIQEFKSQLMKQNSKEGAKKFLASTPKNGICIKNNSIVSNVNQGKPYPNLPAAPNPPRDVPKATLPPPPAPILKIKKSEDGIELSWDHSPATAHAKMDSYELYVYQHNPNTGSQNRWKRIGNEGIQAMALPMACTLSQFSSGSIYYFAVRGKDTYSRYGNFSTPCCSNDVQS